MTRRSTHEAHSSLCKRHTLEKSLTVPQKEKHWYEEKTWIHKLSKLSSLSDAKVAKVRHFDDCAKKGLTKTEKLIIYLWIKNNSEEALGSNLF